MMNLRTRPSPKKTSSCLYRPTDCLISYAFSRESIDRLEQAARHVLRKRASHNHGAFAPPHADTLRRRLSSIRSGASKNNQGSPTARSGSAERNKPEKDASRIRGACIPESVSTDTQRIFCHSAWLHGTLPVCNLNSRRREPSITLCLPQIIAASMTAY